MFPALEMIGKALFGAPSEKPEEETDKNAFCIYCGSHIPSKELRDWHVKNEHPLFASLVPRFCIICGEDLGTVSQRRREHYNKEHSI